MQTFRISRRSRIIYTLISLVFLAASIAGLISVVSKQTGGGLIFMCLVFGSFAALAIGGLLSTYRSLIEISGEKIRVVDTLKTRELQLDAIAGFRLISQSSHAPYPTLLLIPKDPASRQLKITLLHERRAEFLVWVTAHFKDLNAEEHASELATIAADELLGFTEEQRLHRLRSAQRVVFTAYFLTAGACAWAFFAPRPYGWAMGLLIALPLIACAIRQAFPHSVRFDGKSTSAYPQVAVIFILPAAILAFRSFLDTDILQWSAFWTPWLTLGTVVTGWIMWSAKEMRTVGAFLPFLLFSLVYSYGAVIHVNCFYDRSRTQIHMATVQSKRVVDAKVTEYHLKVAPWIDGSVHEVKVGPQTYARHQPGSQAKIHIQEGALKIPFYFVR